MRKPHLVAAITVIAALVAPVGGQASTPAAPDPTTWSNHRLAEQLVLASAFMDQLDAAAHWAAQGVGGIVLFGTPPDDLGQELATVRSAGAVSPLVASDEEGGEVQRLAAVIYRLHSAQWFGRNKTPAEVEAIAHRYATHLHSLGVDVDLAPDADLLVPGYFIAEEHRAFDAHAWRVAKYVNAWQRGMRSAHVATTAKHWPGHGHATDTHTGPATTPPLSFLEHHDLKPFVSAFAHGMPIVMVGNLDVPGLTHRGLPATLSRSALKYLRAEAGPDVLVITDSLTMGAVRSAGYSPAEAAVRALESGADMALVGRPWHPVQAITAALDSGAYPRARAIASVRRILAVKALTGSISS